MRKDHDQARLQDHVLSHVLILAGHHDHRLLAGDALGNVVLIVAPVHLPRLQRGQSLRPVTLMGVLDQVVHDGVRTSAVDEGALDDGLEHGVRSGDHPAPACDSGRLHGVHPPEEQVKGRGAAQIENWLHRTLTLRKRQPYLLQDLIVLYALLKVLQVRVSTADGSHVGFQKLNVSFLQIKSKVVTDWCHSYWLILHRKCSDFDKQPMSVRRI